MKSTKTPGFWVLQDAKARFSELIRRVHSDGPQHVTVHGRDEGVLISAKEFHHLQGERTGEALVAAMQASPCRDSDIEPARVAAGARRDALTGWLLDSNIPPELRRPEPEAKVVALVAPQPP